ncbi:MAG: TIGR03435 family protein [Acidobacteriia bacterium]|nr:TIGR03435 family protein [Terriglobia bacterium]
MRSYLSLLFALSAAALIAQAPPAFEVASVKLNKSETTQANIGMLPNGVNFVNLPLRAIIQFAYGINQPSKLSGVPEWAVTARYDINARAAGPATLEERRLMLQALLADRFRLVARLEKREVSVLALMLARSDGKLGKNLLESKGCVAPGSAAAKEAASAGAQTPICGPKTGGAGRLILTGTPIQQFTALLGLMLSRTVVDKTGLTGRYDIDLTFTPEQPIPAGANIPGPPADPSGPSIYTAVREQLGLKLESQRDQEEVLVIDRVERQPSEN